MNLWIVKPAPVALLAVAAGCLLGILSALASPLLVLAGLAAIVAIMIVIKFPEFGVLVMLFVTSTIIDTGHNPSISVGVGKLYLTDIILAGLTGLILLRLLTHPKERVARSPLLIPLFLFLLVAIIATALEIVHYKIPFPYQVTLAEIRVILNYLLIFLVIQLCTKKVQIERLFFGLVAMATLVAALMCLQYMVGTSIHLLPGRIETLYTEGVRTQNATRIIPPGTQTIFVVFITLTVLLVLRNFHARQLIFYAVWLLTAIGVILTFKRHLWGMAGLAALILLFVASWDKRFKVLYWFQIFVIVAFIIASIFSLGLQSSKATVFVTGFINRISSLVQTQTYEDSNSSLRWRDFEYQYAYPQIESHPLLGLGLGAQYRPWTTRDWSGFDGRGFIHNGHVWLMVKTGLLGYGLFFILMAFAIYRGLRNWRSVSDPTLRFILLGFTLATMGLFIGSIIEPMIVEMTSSALIATIIGSGEAIILNRS